MHNVTIAQRYADNTVNLALDTLEKEKQALIFCNTKRGAESQAEQIARKVKIENKNTKHRLEQLAEKILSAVSSPTKQCKRLALCVRKGIAFHHSGLHARQRDMIETAFREARLKIICATPTLAMGIDMPAFRSVVRDTKRFSAGTSWGMSDIPVLEYEQMCVTADTLISTRTGLVPIQEIVDSDSPYDVLTYDVDSGEYSYRQILAKFCREEDHILRIETKRGYSISLTSNHPILVKRKCNKRWLSAGEIREGDAVLMSAVSPPERSTATFSLHLPTPTYMPEGGRLIGQLKEEQQLSDREVGSVIGVHKKNVSHYKHSRKALPVEMGCELHAFLESPVARPEYLRLLKSRYGNPVKIEKLFTEDFFWLAGIIASDGTLTSVRDKRTGSRCVKIKIGNTDPAIIKEATRILEDIIEGSVYTSKRENGFIQAEIDCTFLADILRYNFGIPHGSKSRSVMVPQLLYTAPSEYIGAYLGGVFDGDGSYHPGRRIHFSTASQDFSRGIHLLLLRLGIFSSLRKEKAGQTRMPQGQIVTFKKGAFGVTITKKSDMQKFAELAQIVKCDIDEEYSTYHNIHRYHNKDKTEEWLPVAKISSQTGPNKVYNIHVDANNNYFANGLLVHNCGRAGRPGKEDRGEAILIAKNEKERDALIEKYILGQPEEIYSKLAVEPVLRTYVLSLIASGYVHDHDSLYGFFDGTFYAFQYGDMEKLHSILDKMVKLLADWQFIIAAGMQQDDFVQADAMHASALEATSLGERVAQLYLDPYTAHLLLDSLGKAEKRNLALKPFPLLHLLCNCLEIRPLSRLRQGETSMVDERLLQAEEDLLVKSPGAFSHEYEEFLQTVKTAMVLEAWIDEVGEDVILEQFRVTPGELQAKRSIGDWLLYSLVELSKLNGWHEKVKVFEKLRVRLQHGAREQLLPMLRLKGIGRIRARKLYRNGIRSVKDVKNVDYGRLAGLLGKKTAERLKEQVGQKVRAEDVQVKRNKRKGQRNLEDF